jgi:2',3'-cyclic-nucleotide 2'-phosphodiesterase (5'-nucleotidase family)
MSGTYSLQILHGSDFEAGLLASGRADRFAAIVDKLEDEVTNSITLSAGDNLIPGPFSAASGDPSLTAALQEFYVWLLGDEADLSALATAVGRVDVAVLNGIGVQASAIGNHDLDFGTTVFADAIATRASGGLPTAIGALFPYLSASLDFSGDPALATLFTDALRDASSYAPTAVQLANAAALAAQAADDQIAPWTTIVEGGETIGILGVTTQLEAQLTSLGGVTVKDPAGDGGIDNMDELAAILQPLVDQMTASGINKIVLLSHLQQYQNELSLAAKLSGVDVIVAGGSHAIFADGTDALRPGEAASETYPQIVTGVDGNPTAIVSTSGEYSYVGRLVVTFDADGVIIPASIDDANSGAYVTTDEAVAALWGDEDAYAAGTRGGEVRGLTEAVQAVIAVKDSSVFGESKVYLEGRRAEARTEETNLGDISADANLWTARQVDDAVTVSFKNGGGIRAEIGSIEPATGAERPPLGNAAVGKEDGEISQLDIENSLRFNNALSIVTVSAEHLQRVLEHSVSGVAPGATPGGFGQWGGIAFTYDPAGTRQTIDASGNVTSIGTRIESAVILNEDGTVRDELIRDGVLLGDAQRAVKVVTLSFLADGGDGYPLNFYAKDRIDLLDNAALGDGISTLAAKGSEQDAMAEYLNAFHGSPYTAYGQEDIASAGDARIQNLAQRDGDVTQLVVNAAAIGGRLSGTASNELLLGSGAADTFVASAGRDTARGHGGNDLLDFGTLARAGGGLLSQADGSLHGFTWADPTVGTSTTFFSDIDTVRFVDASISFADGDAARVDALYTLFQGGTDALGQAFWTQALASGGTDIGQVTQAFLSAGGSIAGLSDGDLVDRLYSTWLGRAADADGAEFWTGRMAAEGRSATVQALAGSAEATAERTADAALGVVTADYNAVLVSRAYDVLLDREVDAAGLSFWSGAAGTGDYKAVIEGVLASAEFGGAGVSNSTFLQQLYQNALGRAADAGGLDYWSDLLAGGTSRASVAEAIITSGEGYESLQHLAEHGIAVI